MKIQDLKIPQEVNSGITEYDSENNQIIINAPERIGKSEMIKIGKSLSEYVKYYLNLSVVLKLSHLSGKISFYDLMNLANRLQGVGLHGNSIQVNEIYNNTVPEEPVGGISSKIHYIPQIRFEIGNNQSGALKWFGLGEICCF